jgi:membrane protease YdiL (CAAX protease family)
MTNYVHAPTAVPDEPAPAQDWQPPARPPGSGRLLAWVVLVVVLAAGSFAANALPTPADPNSAYRYSTGLDSVVSFGILLGLVLLIAHGLPRKETFALYRPKSWPRTLGLTLGVLMATYVLVTLVATVIDPGADPDLPLFWDGSRAAPFVFSFIGVAVLAPIAEELTFRGLGFSLLSTRFDPRIALAGTTLLFALVHGILIALPVFLIVGLALGWLRMRTGSAYPGILMHGAFNGAVTLLAVTVG